VVYAWVMWMVGEGKQPTNPTLQWFQEIFDLRIWAVGWVVVGLFCLFYATRTEDQPAFVLAIGIKVVWGMLSAAGWALGAISASSAAIWIGLAWLVWTIAGWPEPEDHGKDGA
jgi:hypothetical protein